MPGDHLGFRALQQRFLNAGSSPYVEKEQILKGRHSASIRCQLTATPRHELHRAMRGKQSGNLGR
jgi:hypothetical protein